MEKWVINLRQNLKEDGHIGFSVTQKSGKTEKEWKRRAWAWTNHFPLQEDNQMLIYSGSISFES